MASTLELANRKSGLAEHTARVVREIVLRRAGIVLEANKNYLIESRLSPVARALGLGSIDAFVQRAARERRLEEALVDAMTTNETSFFRDRHPFDALADKVLPAIIEERRESRELRIWCAASSSGQEPYTIAMVIRERFPQLGAWKTSILATDISPTMLARTKEGLYSQLEVNRGLDGARLARYFERSGRDWRVRRELRALVTTRALNLIEPFPTLPALDLVFLRNVLIYFDAATKTRILEKVRRVLSPNGWLFLGAAESTLMLDVGFKREQIGPSVVYRPR